MNILSRSRNPILLIGLFITAVSSVWAIQPASSASAACGVTTGRVSSFAGLIVDANWRRYSDGAILESRNTHIYIENADWRGDPDPVWGGNIVRLTASNMAIAGAGVESGQFGQYGSGCGPDGYNAVFGYTTTSGRNLGGGNYQWGPWALDCDASMFGVGTERYFRVTGVEVPTGARAGGSWSVSTVQPPNGYTSWTSVTYTEPAPPDAAPGGYLDGADCGPTVIGWAKDNDYGGPISVHVYVGGPAGSGAPGYNIGLANGYRADLAAAGIGNHAFSYTLPASYIDDASHSVYAYAIGVNSAGTPNGNNPLLSSSPRSFGPCYDYNLTPVVTTSTSSVVQGTNITFSHSVQKTGTNSKPTAYSVRQIVIPPGGSFNRSVGMIDNAAQAGCDARYGASPSCTATVLMAQGGVVFSGSPTPIAVPANVATISTNGYDPGTLVCRILAVNPPTHNAAPTHRWSAPACVIVAKKPYLAIKNGDAWAGGLFKSATGTCPVASTRGFMGSNTDFSGTIYGSYAEYGLLSLRSVTNFGSAGKPLGNKLTFRNTPAPIGNFLPTPALPTIANNCLNDALDYYGTKAVDLTISAAASIASFTSGIYATTVSDAGTVTVTSSGAQIDITAGKHIVLIATGDIVINKNIIFAPGPYASLADIPSLTVISRTGNIRIADGVTRLDGFYQARQKFVTCDGSGTGGIGETSGRCKQPLVINGAVTAAEVMARRIYGGAITGGMDQRNNPAEQIIMRPDLFLSQYGQAQDTNQLRTVDENELPPRY